MRRALNSMYINAFGAYCELPLFYFSIYRYRRPIDAGALHAGAADLSEDSGNRWFSAHRYLRLRSPSARRATMAVESSIISLS